MLVIVIPFLVYLFHVAYYGSWIIDDAGISYVYARNLASGHGLVSQPGVAPVEGYSNFSWVVVLAFTFFFHIFHPLITAKMIGILCVAASYLLIYKILKRISSRADVLAFSVLFYLSLNPSWVAWSLSGLESPLYNMLILFLTYQLVITRESHVHTSIHFVDMSITAFMIFITRTEGILFGLIAGVIMFLLGNKRIPRVYLLLYSLLFTAFITGMTVFRFLYFNDVLPNTYYAKVHQPSILSVYSVLLKAYTLMQSVSWKFMWIFVLLFILGLYYVIRKNTHKIEILIIFSMCITGMVIYCLLPEDWMGEVRFGLPFVMAFPILTAIFVEILYSKLPKKILYRMLFTVFISGIFILLASIFIFRTIYFKKKSIVTFSLVAKLKGREFDDLAKKYHVKNPSVLLADMGGTLYYAKLRVYDLAGLTDRAIAKTLYNNKPAFYKYVFEDIKPTFIEIHDVWTNAADFDSDKRFRRDYVPLYEYTDSIILANYRKRMYSGIYVRREVMSP